LDKQKPKETKDINPIAREGIAFIAVGIFSSAITYYYLQIWTLLPLIITLFMAFFFRNPLRRIPEIEGLVVSPADGQIIRIEELHDSEYLPGHTIRITIFMSIFNVHVNRMPVTGTAEKIYRRSGEYLPAYKPDAPEKNVACYTLFNTRWGKILVTQITGAVARRLVCYAHPGREFTTGQLIGLIRFGSCVQLYLPPQVQLAVKTGEKVRGGETEIGRFNNEFST